MPSSANLARLLREHGKPCRYGWLTMPARPCCARASVVASGTATVEAALIGNPFWSYPRLPITYAIAERGLGAIWPWPACRRQARGSRIDTEEFTAPISSGIWSLCYRTGPSPVHDKELAEIRASC
jgi:hypothetical protein